MTEKQKYSSAKALPESKKFDQKFALELKQTIPSLAKALIESSIGKTNQIDAEIGAVAFTEEPTLRTPKILPLEPDYNLDDESSIILRDLIKHLL